MDEILEVCQTLLDNADLDISLEVPSGRILLDFVVGGTLENIIISCSDYSYLKIEKCADDSQCFFVGETRINVISSRSELQKLYETDDLSMRSIESSVFHIRCIGGIEVEILCSSLGWKIDDSEFKSIANW